MRLTESGHWSTKMSGGAILSKRDTRSVQYKLRPIIPTPNKKLNYMAEITIYIATRSSIDVEILLKKFQLMDDTLYSRQTDEVIYSDFLVN